MGIYKAVIADEFQYLEVKSLSDRDLLSSGVENQISEVQLNCRTTNRAKKGDITVIDDSSFIAVNNKTKSIFSNVGRFIPLENTDFQFMVVETIDGLDYDNSQIDYFNGTKDIKRIRKYAFNSKVNNKLCFKLPIEASPIFFSEDFVSKYKQNSLSGLTFVEV